MSAGGENLPTCQVEHVQDAAERVEDDRAAGDMSGEGGAAGDVGGAFEGIQEGAEPTQSGDPSTIERIEQRVRRHIVPHLGAQPLDAIGTEVLRHWKKRLEKDLGPTSIRLVWATLSSILQAAVEDRRLGRKAKHRRPRTYSLLVTGRERKAINRNYFNSYGWKPALAEAGVIAPLEEGNTNGARVWEPSREHGFHALRHFYASEELEAGESVVSLARWLGHSDPGFTLRKYSHFLPRAGARGSAAIDAIFA